MVVPSDFSLGKTQPSLEMLNIDITAADGSTYSLATGVLNTTSATDVTTSSTENTLREAEAFEVVMKQRISKSSFSVFQTKLQVEIRKGEHGDQITRF